jgi:hypothetical protein
VYKETEGNNIFCILSGFVDISEHLENIYLKENKIVFTNYSPFFMSLATIYFSGFLICAAQ